MELLKAQFIAQEIVAKLKPYCSRIEIAGSIRRKKPFVHDIDIVCIPSNQGQLYYQLQQLGQVKIGGQKMIRCDLPSGISLDVYIASLETWATLLLIRTGSKGHNIRLCSLAKQRGLKLHADGSGLFKVTTCDVGTPREDRIAGDTEASIFRELGLPYKTPEERE